MAFRAPSSTFQPELVWFRLPRFPSHFWIAKYTLYEWNVAAADVGGRLCSKNVVDLPIICMYMTWRSWSGASDIHVGLHSLLSNFSSTWAISSWPDLLSGRHPVHLSPLFPIHWVLSFSLQWKCGVTPSHWCAIRMWGRVCGWIAYWMFHILCKELMTNLM